MCRLRAHLLGLLTGLALAAFNVGDALALRRVALIVGNAKYEHAGVLANTLNDASAIAAVLKNAGFDSVDERDDLGVVAMKRAVRDFAAAASNADVAVIYYSGHGIEAAGVNYLIPIDARLVNEFDVEDETLPLDRLLLATSSVKSLSLIILDACRENPFVHSGDGRHTTRGIGAHNLIGVQATTANTLIAYAAKAGSLSYDGVGPNSPFTSALVKYIVEPGLDIRIALGKVRDDVLASTGRRQEPFVYGSLGGESISLTPATAAATASDPLAATAADYALTERVGSAEAWGAFIAAHREGGFYVELARAQLNRTTPPAPAAPPEPAPSPTRLVALSPASGKVDATSSEADRCKSESARLTGLRNDPSPNAISAFASGMTCVALRPQLTRLMESVGLVVPPTPVAMTRFAARSPEGAGCGDDERELERLRAEPDLARAKALYERLTCAALRPQAQRLMESLGLASPPPSATGVQRALAPLPAAVPSSAADAACVAERSELQQLRSHPDRKAAIAFAAALRCKALAPQAARLLESLGG